MDTYERRKTNNKTKQKEPDLTPKRKTNEERNKKRRKRRKHTQITSIKENGEVTMMGEKKLKLEETKSIQTNNRNLTDKKRRRKTRKFTKQTI